MNNKHYSITYLKNIYFAVLILLEVQKLFKRKNYKVDNFVFLLVNSTLHEIICIYYTYTFLGIKDISNGQFHKFYKNLSNINVLKIKPMFKLFDNTKETVNLKCCHF